MLAAVGSDAYRIVLVLHILCAIVGLGSVFLATFYYQQARARRGPEQRPHLVEGGRIDDASFRRGTLALAHFAVGNDRNGSCVHCMGPIRRHLRRATAPCRPR